MGGTRAPNSPVLHVADSVSRREVRVGSATISMLASGPVGGPTAVCFHGIPTGAELFRDVVRELARAGYRALAPDLPGYGGTRLPPKGDRSIAGAADLFAEWLRQERIGPIWLIGHDFGGMIGQILAVRHPELLDRMTIGNTAIADSWPVLPIRVFRFLARIRLFTPLAASGLVQYDPYTNWVLRRAFADPSGLERDQRRRRVFFDGKFSDPVGRREFAAHLRALDNRDTLAIVERLGQIRTPTQIVWGVEDRYQPWRTVGRRLADAIPGAEVHLIEQAGHFVMLDQPSAYVSALLGWRRGAEPTGERAGSAVPSATD